MWHSAIHCGMHKVLSTVERAQSHGNSIGIELQTADGVHMGVHKHTV